MFKSAAVLLLITGVFSLVSGLEPKVWASSSCMRGELQSGRECRRAHAVFDPIYFQGSDFACASDGIDCYALIDSDCGQSEGYQGVVPGACIIDWNTSETDFCVEDYMTIFVPIDYYVTDCQYDETYSCDCYFVLCEDHITQLVPVCSCGGTNH